MREGGRGERELASANSLGSFLFLIAATCSLLESNIFSDGSGSSAIVGFGASSCCFLLAWEEEAGENSVSSSSKRELFFFEADVKDTAGMSSKSPPSSSARRAESGSAMAGRSAR